MDDIKERLGKVKINERLVWDLKSMSVVFGACIVLNVDRLDYNRVWVYTVACPQFDRLVDGEAVPEYTATISANSLGYCTLEKWEKVI